jgi:hypothetical protein
LPINKEEAESFEVLTSSKCSKDPKEIEFLSEIMGKKKFEAYLRFRGSRDGWKAIDFHSRCDGLGPTLSLF